MKQTDRVLESRVQEKNLKKNYRKREVLMKAIKIRPEETKKEPYQRK